MAPRSRQREVMSLFHNRRYLVIFGLQMSRLETISTKREIQCQRSLKGMHSREGQNILWISSFRDQHSICVRNDRDVSISRSMKLNTQPSSYVISGQGCKDAVRQRLFKNFATYPSNPSIKSGPFERNLPTIIATPFASSFG